MRTISILIAAVILAAVTSPGGCEDLARDFMYPPAEYRGVPFLSLNDDLQASELARQIRELKAQGMGGFFLHSRVGLITPYLSDRWMALMASSSEQATKSGIYAWLYDEDRWPSGFAGGLVPEKGMEYRQKTLELRELDVSKDTKLDTTKGVTRINNDSNVIAWFACKKIASGIEDVRRLPLKASAMPAEGTHVLVFWIRYADKDQWFNGLGYVDTLNPDVIKEFIETTYEPYYQNLGKQFGKRVPGIFTDEPNISATAWTERLPAEFSKRYGYDIVENLPSLYYPIGDWQKVRLDYRAQVTDMFVNAFSKQIYDWCDAHNIQFTGHYLAEDTLVSQLREAGACMPHYEYEHIPGIDHLFLRLVQITTMKQASSAANQLGKKRVLSETFGGSGWNMGFDDQRWIANWQLALGVNLMNQHLCHYSLRGARKRDWPPSIYFQQPYWKYYRAMNDYMARASMMLTRGDFVADVLVIHPISSAWCEFSPLDASAAQGLSDKFQNLSMDLAQLHREFDYGDETLMAKYASVQGKDFVVGRMKYKTVIVPASVNLSANTFKLLKQFVSAGGPVVAVKPTPILLDGRESAEVKAFFEQRRPNLEIIERDRAQLEAALAKLSPSDITIAESSGGDSSKVVVHRRRDGARSIVFLANTDRDKPCDVVFRTGKLAKIEDWRLETGKPYPIPCRGDGSSIAVNVHLAPGGSKLLILDESRPFKPYNEPDHGEVRVQELSDAWRVRRLSPNAITLDYCFYRIGDGDWQGPTPVYRVQREMEGQPAGTEVSLRFAFDIAYEPDRRPMYLVIEQPNIYTITVNGTPMRFDDAGWWVDTSFRKVDISRAVVQGANTVEMKCRFFRPTIPGTLRYVMEGVEIENAYLIGDFGVQFVATNPDGPAGTTVAESGFKLVQEDYIPIIGDLTRAGYPFFVGDVQLSQVVDVGSLPDGRAYLEFDDLNAIAAKVRINGHDAGVVFWQPYRVDVTDYLQSGRNEVRVILSTSLRNLLGPLHHKAGELTAASPGSFTDGGNWTDAYHYVKLGIPGKPRIRWERN